MANKSIASPTFAQFTQSLKDSVLQGFSSCLKANHANGYFTAVLSEETDDAYIKDVLAIRQDETNAFKIEMFMNALNGKRLADLAPVSKKEPLVEGSTQDSEHPSPQKKSRKKAAKKGDE